MNRRAFLDRLIKGTAAATALAVVDPDYLLWTPGAKTFFLPPEVKDVNIDIAWDSAGSYVWTDEDIDERHDDDRITLITPSMFTREALAQLEYNLAVSKLMNRRYDGAFAVSGNINIRVPMRYRAKE